MLAAWSLKLAAWGLKLVACYFQSLELEACSLPSKDWSLRLAACSLLLDLRVALLPLVVLKEPHNYIFHASVYHN